MYNKKYVLTDIEEFNRHNPIYDDMKGTVCYLVYLNPGERGWFLYEEKYGSVYPHRVHTSTVAKVTYVRNEKADIKGVVLETQNTKFTFEVYK